MTVRLARALVWLNLGELGTRDFLSNHQSSTTLQTTGRPSSAQRDLSYSEICAKRFGVPLLVILHPPFWQAFPNLPRFFRLFLHQTMAARCSCALTGSLHRKFRYRIYSNTFVSQTLLRHQSSKTSLNIEELLSKPTWSVQALLPPETQQPHTPTIPSKQLHHLLRLSALPLPESPVEERKMLETLSAQLHFVGEIQQVDTEGVLPLRAIRDETATAEKEQEITLNTLKDALAQEDVVGKHHKRIRRRTDYVEAQDAENWDVLGSAKRKSGKYFVVESERP